MNIALGMIVSGDVPMLEKTVRSHVDAFRFRYAIDTDEFGYASSYLSQQHNFFTATHDWKADFSAARNALIDLAERWCGCDWLLMIDSDEAMMLRDVLEISLPSELNKVGYFPRYNIAGAKRDKWFRTGNLTTYPDLQGRLIPLRQGIRFVNRIHEVPIFQGDTTNAYGAGRGFVLPQHIYHYGLCKPLPELWLKEENRRLSMLGEPPLSTVPDGVALEDQFSTMPNFDIPHPLQ